MATIPDFPACLSTLFAQEFGNIISNAPKKDVAKTINKTKKTRLNQTLVDIKAHNKPVIMIFNKIDAYKNLTIDDDDLITEKTQEHYTLEEWKQTWMHRLGEQNTLFISATQKENFEEFKERLYEAVRQIHITRFPYNNFLYPDYKEAIEEENKK